LPHLRKEDEELDLTSSGTAEGTALARKKTSNAGRRKAVGASTRQVSKLT